MSLHTLTHTVKNIFKDMIEHSRVYEEPIKTTKGMIVPLSSTSIYAVGGTKPKALHNSPQKTEELHTDKNLGYGNVVLKHPVGYLEVDDEKTTFHEIIDKNMRFKATAILLGGIAFIIFLLFRNK